MTPSSLLSAGVRHGDRVRELLGGIEAVAVADGHVRGGRRAGRLTGQGRRRPRRGSSTRWQRWCSACRTVLSRSMGSSVGSYLFVAWWACSGVMVGWVGSGGCCVGAGADAARAARPAPAASRQSPASGDDDFLRDAPELLVLAVAQFGARPCRWRPDGGAPSSRRSPGRRCRWAWPPCRSSSWSWRPRSRPGRRFHPVSRPVAPADELHARTPQTPEAARRKRRGGAPEGRGAEAGFEKSQHRRGAFRVRVRMLLQTACMGW